MRKQEKQEKRPKIVSLLDKRSRMGLPTELELTYTIAEEIDYIHERVDLLNKNLATIITILKQAVPVQGSPELEE